MVTRMDTADGIRLTAAGELDRASAPILAAELDRAFDHGTGVVLVDLGAVTFMDSAGVHALVVGHNAAPTRLRLGGMHHAVRRVLEITGLLDVFAFADDLHPS